MTSLLDFTGKTALITGAASGIGAACARFLAERGAASLILTDIDESRLEALELPCETTRVAGNVGDPAHWDEVAGHLENLDHAVLNAGVAGAAKPVMELDWEHWRRTCATNLDGVFLGLKHAMTAMAARDGGSVVVTASVAAVRGISSVDYGATKAAVAHMARIAGREGGPLGIRVNAIAPGGVDTPIWDTTEGFSSFLADKMNGDRGRAIEEFGKIGNPIGRFATAEEIAGQIAFLLSPMAATINGAVLVSDGGFSI
jgi:NAD(P)-dependent dehydrogenase (short-subunit alcohol dehydrogenase family)